MNTAVINIKTEPRVKLAAQKLAEELGLSLSAMINGFLHQAIKTKTLVFSAQNEDQPTEYLLESLRESEKDLKEGKTISFNSPRAVVKHLDKMIDHDRKSS